MSIYVVQPEKLIEVLAEKLKEFPDISPPKGLEFWKTASFKELAPIDVENFWYIRCASLLRKVNKFDRHVLYLQVDFSKKAEKIYRELLKELKKIKMRWTKYDGKTKFHSTLMYCNTLECYKEAWPYVSKLKPDFNLKFDNITILREMKKGWVVYKTYKII